MNWWEWALRSFSQDAGEEEEVGIVEGDYNTWTLKWNNLVPNDSEGMYETDWFIDEKNGLLNLIWQDGSHNIRLGIFNLADFSTVFLSSAGSNYFGQLNPYSWQGAFQRGRVPFYYGGVSISHETYFLLQRNDNYTHEVWRAGSLLWSHDIRDDIANPGGEGGGVSQTGKYLLLLVIDYDVGAFRLLLYEGSKV